MSTHTAYYKTSLTGGGASALDGIDGAKLNNDDFAFVLYDGEEYVYKLNATSGASESVPDIIAPDVNAGDKRWILQGIIARVGRFGSSINYADFDESGRLTLVGASKRILTLRPEINQDEIRKNLKPDSAQIGVYFGYSMPVYAADNEELFFKQRVPYRWDGASNPKSQIEVCLSGAEDVGDKFKFQFSWEHYAANAVVPDTANDVEVQQVVLTGRGALHSSYALTFEIDYDIDGAGNELKAGEVLGARLRRIASDAPAVTNEIIVLDWVTTYRRDKLGGDWS